MPVWALLYCMLWVVASSFSLRIYARYDMRLALGEATATISLLLLFALRFGLIAMAPLSAAIFALALLAFIGWFQLYAAVPVVRMEMQKAQTELGTGYSPQLVALVITVAFAFALPAILVGMRVVLTGFAAG